MSVPSRMGDVPDEGVERRWFEAGTRRLAIDVPARPAADDAATAALRDAVLLDEHALLLDCLADGLAEDGALDWRPAGTAGERTDEEADEKADEKADENADGPAEARTPPSGAVPIALTLVDARPATGDAVSAARRIGLAGSDGPAARDVGAFPARHGRWSPRVAVYPHRLPAELLLERLPLASGDLARVGEGSVVLLPATFGAAPALTVRAAGANAFAAAGRAPPPAASCDIVLAERFEATAEAIESASAGGDAERPDGPGEPPLTFDVALALDDAALARASGGVCGGGRSLVGRRGELHRDDGGVAVGELVALGSGLALVVDGVERWT